MDIIKKYNHAVKLLADAYRYKTNGNDLSIIYVLMTQVRIFLKLLS